MYQDNFEDEFAGDIDVDVVVESYTGADEYEDGEITKEMEDMHAQMALMQQKHQEQIREGIESIPDHIRDFLLYFHRTFTQRNSSKIAMIYEYQFNKLSEKTYPKSAWPDPRYVSALVNDAGIFLTLYREMYYRHIYSKLQPTIEDRILSFENYCELFNYILNSETPVNIELPNKWLWDIIDEFIYQFQTFCLYRNNVSKKTEREIETLKTSTGIWNTISVLNVLYSLVAKSNITKQLYVGVHGGDLAEAAGEYGSCQLYKMLGYFSLIGLLRVHCLLGDYTLALQSLENIDLGNHRALYTRVPACHVTLYYYVGFSYLMMRRYSDATRVFGTILNFVSRTRQYQVKSFHFDVINKKADQMYALLAMCMALSPSRVDEQTHNTLREKYGEQYNRLQRGGEESLATFQELFMHACPKFISPNIPNYDAILAELSKEYDGKTYSDDDRQAQTSLSYNKLELQNYQMKIFLHEVSLQIVVPTLRSFLKMYTSMKLEKLASFLDILPAELHNQLLVYKMRSLQLKFNGGSSLLDGESTISTDLGFAIDNDVVYIAENKVGRRYADWFIRNNTKLMELVSAMESKA
ncbi:Eukaryotic translation initiation factor 3 subunit L [Smittium culicis]|uniref:Eukaryotic translation initiation factor 3 subunit L n=1 Tax=Smittium culicis TaxID=133412 RepID=A0A1R1YR97_9FUNG|nr:Eukaryotic translation initiation factor 3 subunit L [Smittium culicis]